MKIYLKLWNLDFLQLSLILYSFNYVQKAESASKEKSRASAVALNAEIRRTKARLLEEVPKLQRLAMKKVVFLFSLLVLEIHP